MLRPILFYRSSLRLCAVSRRIGTRYAATAVQPTHTDTFLEGTSSNYIDAMYQAYKQDPSSVHVSWRTYFHSLDSNVDPKAAFMPPPTIIPTPTGGVATFSPTPGMGDSKITNHLKVQLLVRAYQVRGHHKAKIDPLGIKDEADFEHGYPKELQLSHYGFTEEDLDSKFSLGPGILPRFVTKEKDKMSLREIIHTCECIYCGSYGVEYVHIPSREQCDWIRERIEIPQPYNYSVDQKRRILDRLIWSTSFEKFLASKYPNDKRFGLEGCETLIPAMKSLIDESVELGVKGIVIGMPHRGRLNVLSNVVRKPNESIFSEFSGSSEPGDEGSGDVKYHLGMNYERPTPSGKRVNLSLVANPSHLEAEDPVVLGKVRAIQHYSKDEQRFDQAMGLLIHGDAAFAAQGIVYETMGMHALPSYSTGGTIHMIVNNQIGFTTDPRFARSTPYCSDIAKAINAPIFHVNGDDVEALTFISELASEWRAKFKHDVVIDIICYRKHGHNETDQPSFTQPKMYQRIAKQKSSLELYVKQLLDEGTFSEKDIEEHKKWVWDMLEQSFEKSKDYQPTSKEWLTSNWNGFASPKDLASKILPHLPTKVPGELLKELGNVISEYPSDFNIHPNLKRILKARGKTVIEGTGIDMSTGEALAWATLLKEGSHVRVSGQDVERGTFSQRHCVLHDQVNESTFIPLATIKDDAFVICNSSLSEYGVLGFEYGYSLSSPNALVVWEAQFGDFANNAQCIIDQFIASGETKWFQRSGITLSLPHGYDGQGPEHSSGRMERFLQLCNEDPRYFPSKAKLQRQHQDCNMQVVYPTIPSNIFHIKSLLRHPLARSNLEEFTDGHFHRILRDPGHKDGTLKPESQVGKVILCTGQVYATLHKARMAAKLDDVAIIRLEQLHPFDWAGLKSLLEEYPIEDLCWAQEEPLNAGPWSFVSPRLETLLNQTKFKGLQVRYAGRAPSASVATGNKNCHIAEESEFLADALGTKYQ